MRSGPSFSRVLLGVAVWVLAAGGALFVADIPGEFGESVCGVWGCFPPVQALAAMHLFWFVVLVPVVLAMVRWQPRRLQRVGVVMILAAVAAAAAIVGRDLMTWLPRVPEQYHPDWPKRAAYTLLTLSDVPLVQVLLAGVVCVILGQRRGCPRAVRVEPCDRPVPPV